MLQSIVIYAKYLNRYVVFPPTSHVLTKIHNNNKPTNNNWNLYFNTGKIRNLTLNPPFKFCDNGDITSYSPLSIKYYYVYTPIADIDKNIDIIVLCGTCKDYI